MTAGGKQRSYLDGAFRLEHATTRAAVGVHLHLVGVDGGVEHDPGAATQLGAGRQVDEEGLLVVVDGIDNVRAVLEDLLKHVALATGEATPVGQNHQRKLLAMIEVVDRLCRL